MHQLIRKLSAFVVATLTASAAGPSRALTEYPVYPPPGGWGNAFGTSIGQGAADTTLEGVTIVGKREGKLSPIYLISVPFAGIVPTPSLDRTGGDPAAPPDPAKQQACIDTCDQKQKIAKDLCDVAAAKASASGTVASIGIGFAVGSVVSWKGTMLLGAPAGFGAYLAANQFAKDHAATLNLACIGKAAQNRVDCVTGVCKFSG
jgi:hypothetical protein